MQDMKEQARLSGLVLGNNQEEPQWITNPSGVCQRWEHALVVVHVPHDESEEVIVVLGGQRPSRSNHSTDKVTQSVLLFHGDGSRHKQHPRGPKMNERREGLAAVVCNGYVYAIGGGMLDSIERIQVSDLLSSANLNKTEKETPWKTLECRLSTTHAWSSSAAVVQNRYIVIGGGKNGNVDILDISQASQPFIFQGPSLNVPRSYFGMAAIGSRVYAVGGLCEIIGRKEE